ncbi:hypothetical protein ACOMHN_044780 [Nucella lapillus]
MLDENGQNSPQDSAAITTPATIERRATVIVREARNEHRETLAQSLREMGDDISRNVRLEAQAETWHQTLRRSSRLFVENATYFVRTVFRLSPPQRLNIKPHGEENDEQVASSGTRVPTQAPTPDEQTPPPRRRVAHTEVPTQAPTPDEQTTPPRSRVAHTEVPTQAPTPDKNHDPHPSETRTTGVQTVCERRGLQREDQSTWRGKQRLVKQPGLSLQQPQKCPSYPDLDLYYQQPQQGLSYTDPDLYYQQPQQGQSYPRPHYPSPRMPLEEHHHYLRRASKSSSEKIFKRPFPGSAVVDRGVQVRPRTEAKSVQTTTSGAREVREVAGTTRMVAQVTTRPKPATGYTCQRCGRREKSRPRLFLATSHSFRRSGPCQLAVIVFINDERLKDPLFVSQLVSGNATMEQLGEIDLLESYQESRLFVRLRLPKNSWMRHCLDDSGYPLLAIEKSSNFHRLLSCHKCRKKEGRTLHPICQWLLEPTTAEGVAVVGDSGHPLSRHFQAVIDVCHLHADQNSPLWDSFQDFGHTVTSLTFHVKCPRSEECPRDRISWEKHLSDLNERQLERVARALGIADAQILSLRIRCSRSEVFREQLREMCLRQGSTDSGLFIPVIAALEAEVFRPHTATQRHSGELMWMDSLTPGFIPTPSTLAITRPPEESQYRPINADTLSFQAGRKTPGEDISVYKRIENRQSSPPVYIFRENIQSGPNEFVSSIGPRHFSSSVHHSDSETYLKTFAEIDPPPSYHSHFSSSYRADHVEYCEGRRDIEHTEGTDYENHFQGAAGMTVLNPENFSCASLLTSLSSVSADNTVEAERPCGELQDPRTYQISPAAISDCNMVGRAVSFDRSVHHPYGYSPSCELVTNSDGTASIHDTVVGARASSGQSNPQNNSATVTTLTSYPSNPSVSRSNHQLVLPSKLLPANPNDSEDSDQSGNSNSLTSTSGPIWTHLGQLERAGAHTVLNDLNSPLSMVSSGHSSASSVCMEFTISLSDTDDISLVDRRDHLAPDVRKQALTEMLKKTSQTSSGNMLLCRDSASTQTEPEKKPVSPPIVCSQWQACLELMNEGGRLQTEDSDVLLHVPPDAVQSGSSVDVYAAICANVDQIRHVLQLSDDEEILSPLAEYCASGNSRFHRPVSITLPYALPTGYEANQVNVYRVSQSEQGDTVVTKLPLIQTPHSEAESSSLQDSYKPSFCFSSRGRLCVRTDCFSAYVTCAYSNCGLKQDSPVLHAMVCSSQSTDENGQQVVIYTYVWDDRLAIKDFQKENGIGREKKVQSTAVLPLMEDLPNSKLCFCLQLLGKNSDKWVRMQCSGPSTEDPFPLQQSIGLQQVLSCDNQDCKARKVCSQPVAVMWFLETADDCPPDAPLTLTCAVLVSHVPSATLLHESFQNNGAMGKLFVLVKEEADEDASLSNDKPRDRRRNDRMPHSAVRQRVLESKRRHDSDDEEARDFSGVGTKKKINPTDTVKYYQDNPFPDSASLWSQDSSDNAVEKEFIRHDSQYSKTPRAGSRRSNNCETEPLVRRQASQKIQSVKRAVKTLIGEGSNSSQSDTVWTENQTKVKTLVRSSRLHHEREDGSRDGLEPPAANDYEEITPQGACGGSHPFLPSWPNSGARTTTERGTTLSENLNQPQSRSLPPIPLSDHPAHQSVHRCENAGSLQSTYTRPCSRDSADGEQHVLCNRGKPEEARGLQRGLETPSSDGKKRRRPCSVM